MKRLAWVVGLVVLVGLTWWLWPRAEPEIFAIAGDHPGDFNPGVGVDDDIQRYGAQMSIPYRFEVNRLGFRGPDPGSGGAPSIVVMGDSFAFGMGVNEGQTFPDHLRTHLRKRFPDVVVHNAAVPGYTIADQREQWADKLRSLAPDLVLLCHTASDLKEMARPGPLRTWMAHDGDRSDRDQYVFTQNDLATRLGASLRGRLTAMRADYVVGVLALAREVRQAGGRLAVVTWVDGYGMGGLDASPVKDELAAAGIPVFDGNRAMRDQGEVPFDRLFLPDGHFAAAGNALVGRQTADWLLDAVLDRPVAAAAPASEHPIRTVTLSAVSNASGLVVVRRQGALQIATVDEVDEWSGPGDPAPLVTLSNVDGQPVGGEGKAGAWGEVEALAVREGRIVFPYKTGGQRIVIRDGQRDIVLVDAPVVARFEQAARAISSPPWWFEVEGLAWSDGWETVVAVVRPDAADTPRSTVGVFRARFGPDGGLLDLSPPLTENGRRYTDYAASLDVLDERHAIIGGFLEPGAVVVDRQGRVVRRLRIPAVRVEGIAWDPVESKLYLARECPGTGTHCAAGSPFGTPLWIVDLPEGPLGAR